MYRNCQYCFNPIWPNDKKCNTCHREVTYIHIYTTANSTDKPLMEKEDKE